MKFWLDTKTNQPIRLGEWKKMYNAEHRIKFTETDRGYELLHEFIRIRIAMSMGSIVYLGEKY